MFSFKHVLDFPRQPQQSKPVSQLDTHPASLVWKTKSLEPSIKLWPVSDTFLASSFSDHLCLLPCVGGVMATGYSRWGGRSHTQDLESLYIPPFYAVREASPATHVCGSPSPKPQKHWQCRSFLPQHPDPSPPAAHRTIGLKVTLSPTTHSHVGAPSYPSILSPHSVSPTYRPFLTLMESL